MSYDVEVFSAEKPTPPAPQEGRGWQIVVDGPLSVESEDIPEQVRTLLPGIRYLTQFHLEGHAPATAQKKLMTLARGLARAARGVVVDQQDGTVETPARRTALGIRTSVDGWSPSAALMVCSS